MRPSRGAGMQFPTPTRLDALSRKWRDIFWNQVPARRARDLYSMVHRTTVSQTLSYSAQTRPCSNMDEWTPMLAARQELRLAMANKPYIERRFWRSVRAGLLKHRRSQMRKRPTKGILPGLTGRPTQFADLCRLGTRAKSACLGVARIMIVGWLSTLFIY